MSDWWYNDKSGTVESGPHYPIHVSVSGWHGPFKTKEDAFSFYAQNADAHTDWTEPTDSQWQGFKNGLSHVGGQITSSVGDAIGFSGGTIEAGNWFVRIAEIVLGIVLVGVGLAKLTGTTNAIAKIAKVAA